MTTEPQLTPATKQRPRSSRARRVGKWVFGVLLGKVLILLIAAVALFWYAKGKDFAAPQWLNEKIETRLATALPEVAIDFRTLTLSVAQNYQPSLHLTDVRLRPVTGGDQIVMSDVTGSFDAKALLDRKIRPKVISVTGARIQVNRADTGQIGIAFGAPLGPAPAQASAGDPTQTLKSISDFLNQPVFSALRRIEGAGLIVQYRDSQAGRSWTVDGGQLSLARDGDDLALSGNFALLGGHAYATSIELGIDTRMHSGAAALSLRVEDAPARDIATQSPGLAWLGVLDAPISGALRVTMDEEGAIGPLSGTLQIGKGALAPEATANPIPFDSARTYFQYDPAGQWLIFDEISLASKGVTATAEGRIKLEGVVAGIPTAMIGQMRITELSANPAGLYPAPLFLERAEADMRLHFDPFLLELGRLDIRDRGQTLSLSGWFKAQPDGWDLSMTGAIAEINVDHLLELWPSSAVTKTRDWVAKNVLEGVVRDVQLGVRSSPKDRPDVMLGFNFEDLIATFTPGLPPIVGGSGQAELRDDRFVITADGGRVHTLSESAGSVQVLENSNNGKIKIGGGAAPLDATAKTQEENSPRETAQEDKGSENDRPGQGLNIAGTSFVYENTRIKKGPAEVLVRAKGTVHEVLSLIDSEPLKLLSKAGRTPTMASGQADVSARLNFNLVKPLLPEQIKVSYSATLTDVFSDVIVPERQFSAPTLEVAGTASQIEVTGDASLDGIPLGGTWSSSFGPDATGGSSVKGWVTISEATANQLNLGLAPGTLGGTGRANISLDLPKGDTPRFNLTSNLAGVSVAIDSLGWAMSRSQTGKLAVSGSLGAPARIDSLSVSAPGLSASGSISLDPRGGLDRAKFDRVRLGGWLDAPVTLTGRGQGVPPRVAVTGGNIDLRKAKLGGNGKGGPISIALDRLTISDTIALHGMRGDFTSSGGMKGQFNGRVNGKAPISGTISPSNGKSAVRLTSDNAGAVLAAAGFLEKGREGTLNLTLNPTGAQGTYDGLLKVENIWLQDAPAMATLLSALSVVGLLEQMSGNGIHFNGVEADFRLTPDQVILRKSNAVGASMGIAMDGYYNLAAKALDMQGVISPIYALNGIGQIFTRKGEGLLGFNYRLTGQVAKPRVQVNPLSIFTPGMFRDIFRRPPPKTN